jgi:hypothetical protein
MPFDELDRISKTGKKANVQATLLAYLSPCYTLAEDGLVVTLSHSYALGASHLRMRRIIRN